MILVALAFGVIALLGAALSASARSRRARAIRTAASLYEAGFRRALSAAEGADCSPSPPEPRRRNARIDRIIEHKRSPPDVTSRVGYWVAPPVALASHARIEDALSRVIGGPQSGPQICFTGWTDAEKDELKARAVDSGFRVMTNVSVHLNFLCAGQSPGHVKIANAIDVGAAIISGSQFESLCEARTGKTEIQ